MKENSRIRAWPMVSAALILSVLTVAAPRVWKTVAVDGPPPPAVTRVADYTDRSKPVVELRSFSAPSRTATTTGPITRRVTPAVDGMGSSPVEPLDTHRRLPAPKILHKKQVTGQGPQIRPGPIYIARRDTGHEVDARWPRATSLVAQFHALDQPHQSWANEITLCVAELNRIDALDSPEVNAVLQRLHDLVNEGNRRSASERSRESRSALLRANFALQRRLHVWTQVHAITSRPMPVGFNLSDSKPDFRESLDAIDAALGHSQQAEQWRQYLLLSQARELTSAPTFDPDEHRRLARQILSRMESPFLLPSQRSVLTNAPYDELAKTLKHLVSEPVDYSKMLNDLERFEQSPSTSTAEAVMDAYQKLRWSGDAEVRQLADYLDKTYRNANVRFAVSQELANRMLPKAEEYRQNVNDTINGARVRGRSHTSAELRVFFVPDSKSWKIGLEASGDMSSTTRAYSGPASFLNDGKAKFRAQKIITIDRHGLHEGQATARADGKTRLRSMETDYDGVPLISGIVRTFAQQEYDDQVSSSRWQMESRVAREARKRLDAAVHTRLTEAEADFRRHLYSPLRKLGLNPIAINMQTTEQHVISRYRIASDEQLASFSPRPKESPGSLLNLQVSDTAVNNTISSLGLNGSSWNLRELLLHIGNTFNKEIELPDDIPDNVTIKFAKQDAIQMRFQDGDVKLTLKIAEIARGRSRWKNFIIRTAFRPDVEQRHAPFVRNSIISIEGDHLAGLRDKLPLRGIFSKVFPTTREVSLVNQKLLEHPNLADVQLTQFVIDGGWIGVSLGSSMKVSRRPAQKTTR